MKIKILVFTIIIFIISIIGFILFKTDNPVYVSIKNEEIRVKHQLTSDENIIVVYNKNRNNDTFDMSQFIIQSIDADKEDFTGEIVMSTATDFVSPYGLLAVNNTINKKGFTVGGAHGTEGADGYPTSRFGEFGYLKMDNNEITEDGFYEGEKLELKVNHYIFASNTIDKYNSRDSLLEERFYTITSQDHAVKVKLTALEDVILTRYAGLQMVQPDYYDYFSFSNSDYKYKIKGEPDGIYVLDEKSFEAIDNAILFNDSSMMIMSTDRDFGIGTGEYSPESTKQYPQSPYIYTGGKFGKISAPNLGRNNNELSLNTGESIAYRGNYIFREYNLFNRIKYLNM